MTETAKPWIRNALLLGLSLAFALLVFEAGVRWLGIDYRVHHNWRYHPVYGWTDRPNHRYDYEVEGQPVRVQFNAGGFRGPDIAPRPAPGVRRIVVLGDSYTAAVQVNLEQTYPARLQALLEARDPGAWEVVNLGVGDHGNTQQLLILETVALALEPAWVIQQVFPLNDVCNNNPDLYRLCKSLNDDYRPYAHLDGTGGFEIRYPAPARKWLRDHLVSGHLLDRAWMHLTRLRPAFHNPDYWPAQFDAAGFDELDPLLYSFLPDAAQRPETQAGWPTTLAVLEATIRRSRETGARYLGLVVPFRARVGDGWARFSRRLPREAEVDGPERRLGDLYRRVGVPHVLARDDFERWNGPPLYLESDGHLTPDGHCRIAELLLDALQQSGALGSP